MGDTLPLPMKRRTLEGPHPQTEPHPELSECYPDHARTTLEDGAALLPLVKARRGAGEVRGTSDLPFLTLGSHSIIPSTLSNMNSGAPITLNVPLGDSGKISDF